MKISYNWLKWYIPEIPEADKLRDIFTYHLCEVEGIEKKEDDTIFDLNILPNRAHDLLSHQGIARELSGQLGIEFKDPISLYKVPESQPTQLEIKIETPNCRRYMGRIIRNIKVGSSPDWVKKYLESIGQRSINNVVDATNLVMYDSGGPCHAFDLDKLSSEKIIIRQAQEGEMMTTLDGKEVKLSPNDMVITDEKNVLAIAGVKGGKIAEVDNNTKNILLEVANFDPVSVRKTSRRLNILTDSSKRFENNLTPELTTFTMRELSGLFTEYENVSFEDLQDANLTKTEKRFLSTSIKKISKILGRNVSVKELEDVLKRYGFSYKINEEYFTIDIPDMRLDLEIEEDLADEVGRIAGYDKVVPQIPQINFKPKVNEIYAKTIFVRNKLLTEGYREIMTYAFTNKGEVEVLASASDKKFLRANLTNGFTESYKLNKLNIPILGIKEVKIFEIGTVFLKDKGELHVVYNEGQKIIETSLDEFCNIHKFSIDNFSLSFNVGPLNKRFNIWSVYPFIVRDIAVWVPLEVDSEQVLKIIKDNTGDMVVRGPELFDEFKKDDKKSYAFRMVFQSFERTLKDEEINEVMAKISHKISENSSWEIR